MPRLDLGGRTVAVREHGDGPAVILLHSASSHGGQWKRLGERLGATYHVLVPDLHGYGGSDPLPGDGQPCFRHDAAIVTALIGTFEGPAHLVGHSLGGAVALYSALEHADRVASLTLVEPVLFNLLEEADDSTAAEHLQLAQAMTALVRVGDLNGAARMFLDAWGAPGGLDAMDARSRAYVVRTIDRAAGDWFGMPRDAPGALTAGDLRTVRASTLLICGEHTRPSMHRIAAILRAALPRIEYQEVAAAGHMSPITHHTRVNEIIVEFLSRQTAGP